VLFRMEIKRLANHQSGFSSEVTYPNTRYCGTHALDAFVDNRITQLLVDTCRMENYDGALATGYSLWSSGDFTTRSHPSYAGRIWYDWVLADYRNPNHTAESDVECGVESGKQQLEKMFGRMDDIALAQVQESGFLSWYEELVPAKVVALLEYTYTGPLGQAVTPVQYRLVLHCAKERERPCPSTRRRGERPQPSTHNRAPLRSTLLTQMWEMEYEGDGMPTLRFVEPESVAGSVFVREDSSNASPFAPALQSVRSTGRTAKKQRTNKPVYVHSVLDRRDAWPRQFLASVEPTTSVPLDLV
jgi:hypothetical protein